MTGIQTSFHSFYMYEFLINVILFIDKKYHIIKLIYHKMNHIKKNEIEIQTASVRWKLNVMYFFFFDKIKCNVLIVVESDHVPA
jgi:hypothetical protein